MKALFLLVFAAAVFGMCFAVDKGSARLLQKAKSRDSVRLPLRYPILSVCAFLCALIAGIHGIHSKSPLFICAAVCFLGVGIYGLYAYHNMKITYDEQGFLLKNGKFSKKFAFGDIAYQRVAITKRACCLVLCTKEDEVVLYSYMQGFEPFLQAAYLGYCKANGLDPEAQEWHNPSDHRWFPDDIDAEK